MTFTDFLEKARSFQADFVENQSECGVYPMICYLSQRYPKAKGNKGFEACSYDPKEISWPGFLELVETGGVSGGSCWDSSDPQAYSTGKTSQRLGQLDAFLDEVCPQLSHRDFIKLAQLHVDHVDYTEHEYYGNNTQYSGQFVDFEELYKFLVHRKLLD